MCLKRLKAQRTENKHHILVDKVVSQGVWLTSLKPLYIYTGMKKLSRWMVNGGLTIGEVNDRQGEKARMIDVERD